MRFRPTAIGLGTMAHGGSISGWAQPRVHFITCSFPPRFPSRRCALCRRFVGPGWHWASTALFLRACRGLQSTIGDFEYDRPRARDNEVSRELAAYFGVDYTSSDLLLSGAR